MTKQSNEVRNIKLKQYWSSEERREVARERTLGFWSSPRGKKLKKEMHKRKGKPTITNITTSQLDDGNYMKEYQRRYRNHRVSQDGTPYYTMLARFNYMKKKGKIDKDIRFKDYCKENGIVFQTKQIHWEKGAN